MSWTWFAGYFEGEGCISWVAKTCVRLTISSTDRDVLKKAQAIAACGSIYTSPVPAGHKPKWAWSVANYADVLRILKKIGPHLGKRRKAKMKEAFQRLKQNKYHRLYCKHGHRRDANIYRRPYGGRDCLACRRIRDKQRVRG